MSFSAGTILDYQGSRVYVLNTVTHWFKSYTVGLNLTQSFQNNTKNLSAVALYHISGNVYEHVTNTRLFDKLIEKSAKKLQKDAKNSMDMLGDASGSRSELTETEQSIVREYLMRVFYNE